MHECSQGIWKKKSPFVVSGDQVHSPKWKKYIYIVKYYYTTKYKKLGHFIFQETHSILCFRITTPQYRVCAGGKV